MNRSSTRELRVGTWNLAGRWTDEHAAFLADAACDVWLLTEVSEQAVFPGSNLHLSEDSMAEGRRWAGILSARAVQPEVDPHPASALAVVDGIAFCSSILPWRTCGREYPWVGTSQAEKTASALADLEPALGKHADLVWGGDWNHGMRGREYAGSIIGRASIQSAVDQLRLRVVTRDLPHRLDGTLTIDHVAVSPAFSVVTTERIEAPGLSDHDAYVADLRL